MSTLSRVGLLRTSLIDYPGEVAAVIFTAGCNLTCPYCHNPHLVSGPPPHEFIPIDEAERVIATRANRLTGVCITGGEPLLHGETRQLAARIRALGLKVKLDTNGMLPDRIAMMPVNHFALDLKLPPARYPEVGGSERSILAALGAVREHGASYELRHTFVPRFVSPDDVRQIIALVNPGERLVLTAFRPGTTLDPSYASAPAPDPDVLKQLAAEARSAGIDCRLRGVV